MLLITHLVPNRKKNLMNANPEVFMVYLDNKKNTGNVRLLLTQRFALFTGQNFNLT